MGFNNSDIKYRYIEIKSLLKCEVLLKFRFLIISSKEKIFMKGIF